MRKSILYLSIVAALASACAVHEESETNFSSEHTVLFVAEAQPEATRTAFEPGQDGTYPTRWTARDTAVAVSLNHAEPRNARVISGPDYSYAHFEYTVSGQADAYTFHLVTPSSAVEKMSAPRQAWQIRIPAVQTPSADSPDEAAQILAATTGTLQQLPTQMGVRFSHVTAYGRLTLLGLPENATVQSIILSCKTPLAGTWTLSAPTDGTTPVLQPLEASSTLTIRTSAKENVWFACAPGDVSGATLRVIVGTSRGCYEKTVTLRNGRSFKAGKVASFSVDFTGVSPTATSGGDTFFLVTDASILAPGDEIVLLNKEGTYAMSTQQGSNSNSRGAVAVTTHDGKLTDAGSTLQHFTLGGQAGSWNFLTSPGGHYLYTETSNSNYLYLTSGTTPSGLYNWTISIASDGTATIAAPYGGTSTRTRTIMYNVKNRYFNTYTSTNNSNQSLMSIYRKGDPSGNPYEDDPVVAVSEYGAYLTTGNRLYSPATDQISREYATSGTTLTFSILTPATGKVLELGGIPVSPLVGDTFTLQYKELQGISSSAKSYSVKVMRVEGAKVWLSDGNGNGFIVKK